MVNRSDFKHFLATYFRETGYTVPLTTHMKTTVVDEVANAAGRKDFAFRSSANRIEFQNVTVRNQ